MWCGILLSRSAFEGDSITIPPDSDQYSSAKAGRTIIARVPQGKTALAVEGDVNLKLAGKVAFVTGSTAGIGFAIAQSLATEGAQVYMNGRTQERVDAAMAKTLSAAADRQAHQL
jgi:hypothetical protein